MKQLKPLAAAIGGMMLLGGSAAAYAIPTEIQFSTTGSGPGLDGSYDVANVNEFGQSSHTRYVPCGCITLIRGMCFSKKSARKSRLPWR